MSDPIVRIKDVQLVSVSKLVPHPKNPNKHPADQIERLADIIDFQGWRYPIKVSTRSGFVTSGHGRIEAAKLRKWTEVPVSYQDYESEAQEYADVISDNAIAEWSDLDLSAINTDIVELGPDFDIDLLGIKDFVLEPAEKFAPQCDEDEVPENVETICKLGDIWQLGKHRLMCGDSTNVDAVGKLMDGEMIALLFTDPPYGINAVKKGKVDADGGFGSTSRPAKSNIVKAKVYKPIIGDDKDYDPNHLFSMAAKNIITWGANYYADKLPNNGHWLVWDKKADIASDDNTFSDCELAWTNVSKTSVKIFRHLWSGLIRAGNRREEMGQRVHPTQKPVGLCGEIISKYSENEESVLDLFGGSGSTLIACEKTNRKCYMMEIDPHYCDVIVARWEKYTGQKAKRLNEL